MSIKPKKSLGQNFLIDRHIKDLIVKSCLFESTDTVLEIGPGQGAITRIIAPKVKRLVAIEFDRDLIDALKFEFEGQNVEIIHADFLTFDLKALLAPLKVVGNVPYNISTPIIERLIEHRLQITQAYLMFQYEFAERLCASPGGKDYGSLTLYLKRYAQTKNLFKIKRTSFKPVPKVESSFMAIDFTNPWPRRPKSEDALTKVIRTAFSQRRKLLANCLAPLVQKERCLSILESLKLNPQCRAEELNLDNFIAISDQVV